MTPDYYTPAEMAVKCKMSVRWVHLRIAKGDLVATRMGPKLWRIPIAEAEAFLARQAGKGA